MIRILSPQDIFLRPRFLGDEGSWVYLGKDTRKRDRVARTLLSERRISLESRLHEIAKNLRRPFLNFVGDLASHQRDIVRWCTTTLAWKSWAASDFFLLLCYLRLAIDLIQEAALHGNSLTLVIEDRWLFEQLRETLDRRLPVQFGRRLPLGLQKGRLFGWCLLKRGLWLYRIARNYLRHRRAWGRMALAIPKQPAVAIYTFPLSRCVGTEGEWNDPFLPGIDSIVAGQGYETRRFTPPESWGLEKELGRRTDRFLPLVLFLTRGAVAKALVAYWRPTLPADLSIVGLPVRRLVEREWWKEIGTTGPCVTRIYYETLRQMLQKGSWQSVVFPFENQPWEKLTSLCAQEVGVRTIGIQHALFSTNSLSYFESDHHKMPLPDTILTSGPYVSQLLAEGGIPEGKLTVSGSLRYRHVGNGKRLPPAPLTEILIALPIDRPMIQHLLAALRSAFPQGERGIRFHIRPHPAAPVPIQDCGFPAQLSTERFDEALRMCGLVLFAGSTVGPEAVALGRKAVRFCPELLLNVDPSEAFGDLIPTCTETTIRDTLLEVIEKGTPVESPEALHQVSQKIFAPFDATVLKEELKKEMQ